MLIGTDAFGDIDFPAAGTVVAAVSGGSDSAALLVLLHRFLGERASGCRLVVCTINHDLRAESAQEAVAVETLCRRFGIAHMTKLWAGRKPTSGLAAAARTARYGLLREAADEVGAAMILTGHTADDQAETVAMRAARGDGRGLAGMARATLLEGRTWLMRPLLDTRREALREVLRAGGLSWLEDPSNSNDAWERSRTRRHLSNAADVDRWLAVAKESGSVRREQGVLAAQLIQTNVSMPTPGLVRIDPQLIADGFVTSGSHDSKDAPARSAAAYAMRLLLAVVGGRTNLPDAQATAELIAGLERGPMRATLSGVVVDGRKSGIWLHREARNLPESVVARDGDIWDGRFRIEVLATADDAVVVKPLGRVRAANMPAVSPVPPAPMRAAAAGLPALAGGGILGPAAIGAPVRARPVAAPWHRFLPGFDLAPARAVAALIGADMPPDPPYRSHTSPRP